MDDSDHKPKPIMNPLTETEARDFIADEVSRGLWKHVRLFSSLFGIANVVALFGIWFAVQNAAQNVVTQEASRILGTEDQKKLWNEFWNISGKLTDLDKSLSQKEDHLTNLDKSLADKDTEVTKLDKSISEREHKLAEISQSIQVGEATLNSFLSSAQTDATKLSGFLKQVSEEKASQLARVLASIPSQGSDIIAKLDEVLKKLEHCFNYSILVASSSEIKTKSKVKKVIAFDQGIDLSGLGESPDLNSGPYLDSKQWMEFFRSMNKGNTIPKQNSVPTIDTKRWAEFWRSLEKGNSIPKKNSVPAQFGKEWQDIIANTFPLQLNTWALEVENTLPKEAKVIDAWCIPVGQVAELPDISGVEISSENPSTIELTSYRPIPEKVSYKVYILYRTPLPSIASK